MEFFPMTLRTICTKLKLVGDLLVSFFEVIYEMFHILNCRFEIK